MIIFNNRILYRLVYMNMPVILYVAKGIYLSYYPTHIVICTIVCTYIILIYSAASACSTQLQQQLQKKTGKDDDDE